MTLCPFGNGVLKVLNRFSKNAPLCHQRLRHEGIGHHAPRVSRQRHGALDGCQALMKALLPAHVMLMQELFKYATPGALSGVERWPLTEKVTTQSRVLLRQPLEHGREIRLQRPDESMGSADPSPSQATPVFHQWGQGAHLGALGHEGLELLTVPQEERELECGIGRIVLRTARGKGLAISRQPQRIDVKEHKTVVFPYGLDHGPLIEFQSNGDGLALKALPQVRGPRCNHCWPVGSGCPCSFVRARDLQADIMLRIGPIEANEGRKLPCCSSGHASPPIGHESMGQDR
jgi:hypothetical protein